MLKLRPLRLLAPALLAAAGFALASTATGQPTISPSGAQKACFKTIKRHGKRVRVRTPCPKPKSASTSTKAITTAAAAARDGMIVFVSDRDGSDAIWGIVSGKPRELTHPDADNGEDDSNPSFSTDGKHLIFIREAFDGSSNLWSANADGSNAHQLVANVFAASFSPDGTQLAVIVPSANGDNALGLVSASGDTPKVICDANYGTIDSPAFSPDGKEVAYSDDGRGIAVATLGSTVNCSAALLGTIGSDNPSFGPDGTIAWDQPSDDGGFDIWIKRPNQPTQKIIADGSNNIDPVIAPAGDKLVFSSDNTGTGTQVFTANLDGSGITSLGDPQQFCTSGYCQGDSNPSWQPLR